MHTIDCPIKDVSAQQLGLLCNGVLPENILAEQHLSHGNTRLHLGVIGASHVVSIYTNSTDLLFREEISCTAKQFGQSLPPAIKQENYQLTSAITQLDDHGFTHKATEIINLDLAALVVRFPGHGQFHVTSLLATPTQTSWKWTSYHLYPRENTIVTTWSTFQL